MDKFLRFSIVFLGTFLVLNLFFSPDKDAVIENRDDIEIELTDSDYTIGDLVSAQITNNTDQEISLGSGTPPEKLIFSTFKNGQVETFRISDQGEEIILAPNSSQTFSYPEKNAELFSTEQKYSVTIDLGEKKFSQDFEVSAAGFWKSLWRGFVWKPVYNGLIFFMNMTAKDLGWAIILLTIAIKLILFFPTQKAMKSQRKMQKLQPELQKIKTQNKGNQQVIAQKSMELWKKNNVNPFSSILPILLQFPFLIALFYVVQEGLEPNNHVFLYTGNIVEALHIKQFFTFDYSNINTLFLGLVDMLQTPWENKAVIWLPFLIAITQYFAMKLAFAHMEKRKENEKKDRKKSGKKEVKPEGFMGEFQAEFQKMNKVFIYFLPAMILVFSMTMPAAVGLYWFISTLFSIGQQYIVNKEVG